ncbi:MAG: nitroreductase family protein [Myxococcota bacterium]|nr:nitroreductase family protein [Myxococcota bacterium]
MKSDEFDRIMTTTRSVRRRLDFERPVDPELIEACIDVATQAPTGLPTESWRFLIVTETTTKVRLAEFYREALATLSRERGGELKPAQKALAERLHEVPVLILACALGRPAPDSVPRQVAFYGSILPAAWSLMLALRARGLGATWTTLHLLHEEAVAELLGIPADVTQTVLLPVGHLKDAVLRPAKRRPAAEVSYWNQWGKARKP